MSANPKKTGDKTFGSYTTGNCIIPRLKKDLLKKGWEFSTTATQVVPTGYMEYGPDCKADERHIRWDHGPGKRLPGAVP